MLRATLALWKRDIVRFCRQRSRIVGALGTPIVFWALLGSGLGSSFQVGPSVTPVGGYLEYFYPGTLALIVLFTAIIWGGWETTITSWQLKEFEGAGSFEVPVYPVRTLIIIFSGICCLIYMQLLYYTVTGKIAPKKG